MVFTLKKDSANKKAKPSTFVVSFEYIKRYPIASVFIIICLILASLSETISIVSIIPLLSVLLEDQSLSFNNDFLTNITLYLRDNFSLLQIMILIALGLWVKGLLLVLTMYFVGSVYTKVAYDLRKEIIDGLTQSKWAFFIKQPIGELSHTIGFDVNTASHAFRATMDLIANLLQALIYIVIASFMNFNIIFVSLLVGAVGLFFSRLTMNKAKDLAWVYNDLLLGMAGQVSNVFSNFKPFKAMAADNQIKKILYKMMDEARIAHRTQILYIELAKNFQEPSAGTFLIIGLFALVTYGNVSFGEVIFFVFIFHRILKTMLSAQSLYIQILRAEPNYWNIQNIIKKTNSDKEEVADKKASSGNFKQELTFKDLSFSYEGTPVLNGLNLSIKKGERIVITGESGAGKSTFLDMVCGLLTPQTGEVTIDEKNLADFGISQWRNFIGFVPQDSFLLNGTIYENIAFQDDTISEKDVEDALKKVEIWDVVKNLEDGVHTEIGERGMRLSGGQRQRISLARALIQHPSILILDEATSALDFETERRIVDTIKNTLDKELTIIAVTHRKAIIDIADRVYELKNGKLKDIT